MAWQNPKTNWTGADGVTAADLNRIEGNIQHLNDQDVDLSAYMLTANKTIYVSYNGSTSGNGTSGSPFRYLNQAVNSIPKNLNGNTVTFMITGSATISITNANLNLTGFSNGRLSFNAAAAGPSMLSSYPINVSNGSILDITGFTSVDFSSGFSADHNGLIYVSCPIMSGGSVQAYIGGRVISVDTITAYGSGIGIYVASGALIYSNNFVLRNTMPNGLWATDGGVIAYNTITNNATTTKMHTSSGGRIYSGAQTNMPVY